MPWTFRSILTWGRKGFSDLDCDFDPLWFRNCLRFRVCPPKERSGYIWNKGKQVPEKGFCSSWLLKEDGWCIFESLVQTLKPSDLCTLILRTGLAGDVSLKWFPSPSVMYAQPVDARGMIGYSRKDEILQLLLEYIRHRENGHGPLIICGKEVHWNKMHFKGRSCYWQLSRGMFGDMLTFLGSDLAPPRLLWSQPWLLGRQLPKGWWRWDGAREISPGSRSQLHSTNDLLNA